MSFTVSATVIFTLGIFIFVDVISTFNECQMSTVDEYRLNVIFVQAWQQLPLPIVITVIGHGSTDCPAVLARDSI